MVDVAATCTENGQQSRHCERCGAVSDEEVILATGHSFGEWVSDGNATCTENGTETRVCAACGESETRTQEGSATGHSFGEWTIDAEAGCEAAGQRSHTCSACGIVETEEIPALGHVWGEPVVDVAATCTENGQQSRHCERCGAVSDEEVILATGHSFGEWVSDGNATCTEDGTETRVCAACGESETRTQEGSAKGHSFGEWVYDGNATYEADGTETRVCSVCGTKETRVKEGSALQHSWSEEWTIDKAATCTEAGERSHHCTTCDERKDIEEIPAAGHSFGEWTVTKAATCQEAGERFHTCTVCGVTETEIVPQLAHDFSAWSLVNAPTCTEAGTRSRFCSVGGETETQTIPAMGHAFGAWVSDGNATCTQDGTETRTCERCGVKESRYVIGSALGHDFQSFYTVDIPATTETEGVKSRHCSRCEERTDFVSIPVMQENVTTETITDLGTGLSTGANLRALLDTLLTAAEKQELKNGAQVSLRLSGEGISYLTGYDYSQLLRTLNGTGERYFIGEYVSIRLQKTVGTTNTAIREIKNPIRLTIQIPESVKSHSTKVKREFELVRIYNGMVDFMKDLDDSADTITIETDKFTSYAIVYRENEIQEIEQPGTSSGKGTGFTKKGLQDLSSELAALLEYRYPEIFLVSRFAEGEIITKERLQMVADAERYLRRQGFAGSMVHVYGSMASIELRPEDVSRFLEEKTREKICKQLQEYGFTQVALDLRSYAENEQ